MHRVAGCRRTRHHAHALCLECRGKWTTCILEHCDRSRLDDLDLASPLQEDLAGARGALDAVHACGSRPPLHRSGGAGGQRNRLVQCHGTAGLEDADAER